MCALFTTTRRDSVVVGPNQTFKCRSKAERAQDRDSELWLFLALYRRARMMRPLLRSAHLTPQQRRYWAAVKRYGWVLAKNRNFGPVVL
jgi:hypothetical protein